MKEIFLQCKYRIREKEIDFHPSIKPRIATTNIKTYIDNTTSVITPINLKLDPKFARP